MSRNLEDFTRHADTILSGSVRFRKKIDELTDDYCKIADIFRSAKPDEREKIKSAASNGLGKKLIVVSGRCAERAIDSGSSDWIDTGLLMYLIEDFADDYRENYRMLVVLDHAARSIGYSLESSFGKYVDLASERASRRIKDFLLRDAELNRLSA